MADRSPEFIQSWLDRSLYKFDGPSQYLGKEPGTAQKDWSKSSVRTLITASWPYEQASGNMAIPAVYRNINSGREDFLCDRFYLPMTPRDLKLLDKGGVPLFGIESKHQAKDFDIVGTSISYTVLFMNFCRLLTLGGIPLRSRDRESHAGEWPMVIVGGQAFCAPGFMEPVVDCVWLGEVEDEEGNGGISEVLSQIAEYKKDRTWETNRLGCYDSLARKFSYLYFPKTVKVTYHYMDRGLPKPSKQVSGYSTTTAGLRLPLKARKVKDLNKVQLLTEAPLLFADPTMGAGDLEVSRGCPAWCSFCRLSWVTKPYRQESVSRSIERAAEWRKNMGSAELSPFGPDFPMHTEKKSLLAGLMEKVSDEVDTSSMRVDDFIADPDYSMIMAVGGTDSITLGLEGNSQRMRDLVGKGTSDADVEEAVTRAIRAGIRKIKLYMISNMPGEDVGDVMRIVELGRKLSAIRESFGDSARGVRIQFSWTPLLIEAQTPLQWFAPTPPDYSLQEALDRLRELRIDMKIGTKAQPEKLAFFQACQRASRAAGEALVDVIEELGTASWGGFAKDMKLRLDEALRSYGFHNGLDDLFGERFKDDLFGWEYIDTGVSRDLMWDTYRQMVEFLEGTDAETYDDAYDENYHGNEWVARCDTQCQGKACGACSHEDLRLRTGYIRAAQQERDLEERPVQPVDQTTVAQRARVFVDRPAEFRFVTDDSFRFIFRRACYRAEALTEGFPHIAKRSIRLASDALKYRDRSAGRDYVEVGFTRTVSEAELGVFMSHVGNELRPWMELLYWGLYPADAVMPSRPLSLWDLEVAESEEDMAAAFRKWDKTADIPVKIKSETFYAGEQQEDGNAKDHVEDLWLVRDKHRLILRMVLSGKLGPYQTYAALAGKPSWIEAASRTALRQEFFDAADLKQGSLLSPVCVGCGLAVPLGLLGEPFDANFCPRCRDEDRGSLVAGLYRNA